MKTGDSEASIKTERTNAYMGVQAYVRMLVCIPDMTHQFSYYSVTDTV